MSTIRKRDDLNIQWVLPISFARGLHFQHDEYVETYLPVVPELLDKDYRVS